MAERRMFAKTIIDSDSFLDMPLSAQALYFHLSMRADDDGFINNPKKIQRMIGASDDDCKLLIAKRFIITFESGVIVIKHWKIHNYIRNDRYKPTVYKEEKAMLIEKENKVYTEAENVGIPNGYQLDTQVRLGKDRIELGKDRKGKDKWKPITDLFNSLCPSLTQIIYISEDTKAIIEKQLEKYTLDDFKLLFQKAEASDFLKGDNEPKWAATFEWLIEDQNMAKVLNGNFDNRKSLTDAFDDNNYDHQALERMSRSEPVYVKGNPELEKKAAELKEQLKKATP